MGRNAICLTVSHDDRFELERRAKARRGVGAQDVLRARIVLMRAEGKKEGDVAAELGTTKNTVGLWTRRYLSQGLSGLKDAPGRGRKPSVDTRKIEQIVTRVTQPPAGRTRWSVRSMAKAVGVSRHTVHTVWRRNDLKPHRTRTFKLSKDPLFEQKFWDVIGLYLNPPDKALVLCCDEKSQCQALERTQPGLPLGIGHIRTKTHDYIRHGTVCLFAALNYLQGKIISRTETQHRHEEWLAFLKQIDRETPKNLDLHLVADNYGTHKHPVVKNWLAKHPRFHMHFTPTGSSWLNMVERFFADLTGDVVREGSFTSVADLSRAIEAYMAERNANPKPYCWKADGAAILAKIARARETQLKQVNSGTGH
jgi:transposase